MSNTKHMMSLMQNKRIKSEPYVLPQSVEAQDVLTAGERPQDAPRNIQNSDSLQASVPKKPSMADILRMSLTKKDRWDNTPH